MKNKTYMFGVKLTISLSPSFNYECVAKNEKDALVEAREFFQNQYHSASECELCTKTEE